MTGWGGIEEFVAVARSGSFIGGARTLGKSSTHMSRAVASLEKRLQVQLLYRSTRNVALTDSGRAFFGQCERMIKDRDRAVAAISESGEPQGELRIASATNLGERFVVPLAHRYMKEHPELSITVELSNRQFDLIGEGFDLAVRIGHLPDSRLVATRIALRRLYTCASPRYLEEHGVPRTIEDLYNHQCLIGSKAAWDFSQDKVARLFKVKGRWRCNSGHAVLLAALADMGICQLPDVYVREHIEWNRLVSVLEKFAPPDEPIWVIYPQQHHLLPKVRKFVDLLKSEMAVRLAVGC